MVSNTAEAVTALTAVAVVVGVAGTVIPALPGSLLIGVAVLLWALLLHTTAAWTTALVVAAVVTFGGVTSQLLAGRRIMATGVLRSTIVIAGVAAVAGFFLIPMVGLPVGLVAGLYGAETVRLARMGGGHAAARRSTVAALRAMGLGILVEATCAAVAGSLWLGVVLLLHVAGS